MNTEELVIGIKKKFYPDNMTYQQMINYLVTSVMKDRVVWEEKKEFDVDFKMSITYDLELVCCLHFDGDDYLLFKSFEPGDNQENKAKRFYGRIAGMIKNYNRQLNLLAFEEGWFRPGYISPVVEIHYTLSQIKGLFKYNPYYNIEVEKLKKGQKPVCFKNFKYENNGINLSVFDSPDCGFIVDLEFDVYNKFELHGSVDYYSTSWNVTACFKYLSDAEVHFQKAWKVISKDPQAFYNIKKWFKDDNIFEQHKNQIHIPGVHIHADLEEDEFDDERLDRFEDITNGLLNLFNYDYYIEDYYYTFPHPNEVNLRQKMEIVDEISGDELILYNYIDVNKFIVYAHLISWKGEYYFFKNLSSELKADSLYQAVIRFLLDNSFVQYPE